ncbi:hypothetical protein JW887_03985 [Candidatus Dojkabacteria bacterium]|nr:hypothetical protein [Candidatus Dojkabacteria bacterium]
MSKKKIIIDKNTLQGNGVDSISQLAHNHIIILPHVLFEECLTTQKKQTPMSLLKKAETIIKAGAFISFSRGKMLEIEKDNLRALDSIVDEVGTNAIRDNNIEDLQIDFQKEADECNKSFEPALGFIKEYAQKMWETLSEKNYSIEWRKSDTDNDPKIRFQKFAKASHELTQSYINYLYPSVSTYVQNNWITWCLFQLIIIYGLEWAYKRNVSGQSYENFDITNDVYDLEYIMCLTRSDVLISQDKKMSILAQSVLPDKAIYSELNG